MKSIASIALATSCVCRSSREPSVACSHAELLRETAHLGDRFHERLAGDLVLGDTDDRRRSLGGRGEDGFDGFGSLKSRENSIVRGGVSASLRVSESRDARVEAEAVREDLLDVVRGDRVELAIVGTLGNDYDRLALAFFTVLWTG